MIVLSRVDLVLLFLIIFDMAVKPSFSDGWTLLGALAVAAALAALVTRGGTAPSPPAAA